MDQVRAPQEVAFIAKAASDVMYGRLKGETFRVILVDYVDHLAMLDDRDQGTAGVFEKGIIAGVRAASSLIKNGFIREVEHVPEDRGYSYTWFFHQQIDEDSINEKLAATWILGKLPSVWRLRTVVRRLAYSRRELLFDIEMEGEGIKFMLSGNNNMMASQYMFTSDQTGNLLQLLSQEDLKHKIVL